MAGETEIETTETDGEHDGTIEVDPDAVVTAAKTNTNLSARNDNRRVVKVWRGVRGWTHQIVQAQEQRYKYPDTRPHFVPVMALVDGDDKYVTGGPPSKSATVDALDVPSLPEDRTEEEEELIDETQEEAIADWEDAVRRTVGGSIRLVEEDHEWNEDQQELEYQETTHVISVERAGGD